MKGIVSSHNIMCGFNITWQRTVLFLQQKTTVHMFQFRKLTKDSCG